jgi:hypothetical protein
MIVDLQGVISSTSTVTVTLVLALYIDADIDLVASSPCSLNQNFSMYQGEMRAITFTYTPASDLATLVDDIGWRCSDHSWLSSKKQEMPALVVS